MPILGAICLGLCGCLYRPSSGVCYRLVLGSVECAQNGHQSRFLRIGGVAWKVPVLFGRAVRPLWFICGPNCVTLGRPSWRTSYAWPLYVDYGGVCMKWTSERATRWPHKGERTRRMRSNGHGANQRPGKSAGQPQGNLKATSKQPQSNLEATPPSQRDDSEQ